MARAQLRLFILGNNQRGIFNKMYNFSDFVLVLDSIITICF